MALPNSVIGNFVQNGSPLNGEDITDPLIAAAVWNGEAELPGEWTSEAGVANASSAYLNARPVMFGSDALLVRAMHRDERLEELQVTFADAGSFFGYLDKKKGETEQNLEQKNIEFEENYTKVAEALEKELRTFDKKPKEHRRGRSRDLRAEYLEYDLDDQGLVVRLLKAPNRLIRINISRKGREIDSWLDLSLEKISDRERLASYAGQVVKSDRGDVTIDGVEVIPQGYRPYCGLNTLAMVSRYVGLHLDEDWLAVAGKFQNTGSAEGSDMMGLYNAVAREAQLSMKRESRFDVSTVRRSLKMGLPVVVWRRWDRQRDRLHTKVSREFERGGEVRYESPDLKSLPTADKKSPVHASVIIGFNDERQEVIFLESWEAQSKPRRMPLSEMKATADWVFCFQP